MARGTINISLLTAGDTEADLNGELRESVVEASEYALTMSRTYAEPHRRTGEMERGIDGGPIGDGSEGYEVYNDVRHSLFVHERTRPHLITPRRRRALHFFADSVEIFATRVRHPGYEGDPFMERAVEESLDMLEERAGERVEREWGSG